MSDNSPVEQFDAWLSRAGKVLRELPDPGWDALAGSVIDAVRAAPRGGWPLKVHDRTAEIPSPDLITVSDLVLRGALARALRFDQVAVSSIIELFSDGEELRRIRIELTGRYGTELHEVVDTARAVAVAVVDDLLGIAMPEHGIDIEVTDIVDGDPLHVDPDPNPDPNPDPDPDPAHDL